MAAITVYQAIDILQKVSSISLSEALTQFENFANLDKMENVLNDIEKMEKEYYLKQHPYEIYYSVYDKRWRSYLPCVSGSCKRKSVSSVSRENLENKIIDHYKKLEEKPIADTIEKLYPAFLSHKMKDTSLANSHKINWAWERYYQNDPIAKCKLADIKVIWLKEWFLDKIEKLQLTSRQFREMKSLLNMLYDYAIELEIVRYNVSRAVRNISYKKFARSKRKPAEEQVFMNTEEMQIIHAALAEYHRTSNIAYLAICLNFSLALRVGELVSLKVSDFSEHTLHIQRQEVRIYQKHDDGTLKRSGYEIVSHTKSLDSDRTIVLTSSSKLFYSMILQHNQNKNYSSEYLLLDKHGNRIHNDVINYALRQLNKKLGILQKGNHSIRKTCLSNMNASHQLTDEELRAFAGHKDISTTQNSYIYMTESIENRLGAYEVAVNLSLPEEVQVDAMALKAKK